MKRNHLFKKNRSAFTLVEVVTIIGIMSILATVGYFSWNGWQTSLANSEVKQELQTVAVAMKNDLNFNNAYPSSISSKHKVGPNVVVRYVSGDASQFCIEATSSRIATVKMYISSANTTPSAANCDTTPKLSIQAEVLINGSPAASATIGSSVNGRATVTNVGAANYTVSLTGSFNDRSGFDPDQPPVLNCNKSVIAPNESTTCLTQTYIVTPVYNNSTIQFYAKIN